MVFIDEPWNEYNDYDVAKDDKHTSFTRICVHQNERSWMKDRLALTTAFYFFEWSGLELIACAPPTENSLDGNSHSQQERSNKALKLAAATSNCSSTAATDAISNNHSHRSKKCPMKIDTQW